MLLAAEAAEINTRAGKNSDRQPQKRGGIARLVGEKSEVNGGTYTYRHSGRQNEIADVS